MGAINSLPLLCRRCRLDVVSACQCYIECPLCGHCYLRTKKPRKCPDRVHVADQLAHEMWRSGYFIVDPASGKLYKSATSNIKGIYERLRRGTIWLTRRDYNAEMRPQADAKS